MTLRRAYIGFLGLIIGLFLAFQITATAHASEFGENPHEHDGISCVITTLAETDQGILPVKPEVVAEAAPIELVWVESFTPIHIQTNLTRAPPPRGPPANIH